jgi:hypothetical protein
MPKTFPLRDYDWPNGLPGHRLGAIPDAFRCKATAKSTGQRCACIAVKGSGGRCRHHFGNRGGKPSLAKQYRIAALIRGERDPALSL